MSSTTYEKKYAIKNGVLRMSISLLVLLLEAIFIILLFTSLNSYTTWISGLTRLVALIIVLALYGSNRNSSMKMPWIILIMFSPIVGVGIYFIVGLNSKPHKMRFRYYRINQVLIPLMTEGKLTSECNAAYERLKSIHPGVASVSNYIRRNSGYPIFDNSDITFYSSAVEGLEAQKKAMREAKSFIFFEYHAIEDDIAWNGIFEIMKKKVEEGVEVRVFYDDMGSIGFITTDFINRLANVGIQCRVFNPFSPGLNFFLNNRDHRKITVIDGKIGFTGGYNIANEYFDITHPYGKWKDTGVKIEGEAVRNLTIAFMENWNAAVNKKSVGHHDLDVTGISFNDVRRLSEDDKVKYLPNINYTKKESNGFIQPYADSPLDDEQVGEEVYISIINNSKKYCWFVTPYLIISDEMNHALGLAAKRGVDVRIVTPGIPDKKIVNMVTKSYYSGLVKNGVRIYEWKPGFCHCKMCVSDDIVATCGTINLDYRSLYHHFENGCLYADCQAVFDTRDDFFKLYDESVDVTDNYKGLGGLLKVTQMILRLVAVLM